MNNIEQVFQICKNANFSYLEIVLSQLDETKKQQVEKMFDEHMLKISYFCIENFLEKETLTEKFIRNLHKIHFPAGYQKTKKTLSGDGEVVVMLPGVYKSSPTNFNRVGPGKVKKEIKELLNHYNENIDNIENKIDFILEFILNFYKIHPFGDANGRIISILGDLMFIKNGFSPIFIKSLLNNKKYKDVISQIIDDSIKNNNKYMFINKIKELI